MFFQVKEANADGLNDLHAFNGDWPVDTKLPLVGGHEGAGIVVSRGELVHDITIGDHVGVKVQDILPIGL